MNTTLARTRIDPDICHGQPVIRGTRVPVAVVTGGIEAGMTPADVISEYGITEEDIEAALSVAEAMPGEGGHER